MLILKVSELKALLNPEKMAHWNCAVGKQSLAPVFRPGLKEYARFVYADKGVSLNFATMVMSKRILLSSLLLLQLSTAVAQHTWATPELSQMYFHAGEYMVLGNYKEAITIYKQALLIDPDKFILCKDLGNAQFLSGNYSEAVYTLQPLIDRVEADEQCYYLLAESYAMLRNTKEARNVLNKGVDHFPASGMLYYETGKMHALERKQDAALDAWLKGIEKAPAYAPNYYEAALVYQRTGNTIWSLLYGEIYLNLAKDTTGIAETKQMLVIGYKAMFDKIAETRQTKQQPVTSFTDAVQDVYSRLTPVVSDGINTENLTMVRTRFVMDWRSKYGSKYPFSLFSYHDYLLRNGLFDIYNEWLFGNAINAAEYNAWNQFHPGELDIWFQRKREHPLMPATTDFYNIRN